MAQGSDTTVVTTGGGGAGWFVAGVALVVAIVLGYMLFEATAPSNDVEISVEVPDGIVPEMDAGE